MLQVIARVTKFFTCVPFEDLKELFLEPGLDVHGEDLPLRIADQRPVDQARTDRIVEKPFDPESR